MVAEVSRKKVPHSFKTADLTVHITDKQHFGISLLLATGSEALIAELQRLAKTKGLTLTTEGLRRGSKIIASETETGIYKALGLPLIPPELREGRGEIPAAQEDRLPELVSEQDIQGILHAHT